MGFAGRLFLISSLISGAFLAACATSAEVETSETQTPETKALNQLGPQTLSVGECGLFGWTSETTPRFVFFATETRGSYWTGAEAISLSPTGTFPNLDYTAFDLELGVQESYADALRYRSARLRQTLDDGFERIQPLVILETCQEADRR